MFCKNCGKKIPDKSNYCCFCGTSRKDISEDDDDLVKDLSPKVVIPILICVILTFFILVGTVLSESGTTPIDLNLGINKAENSDIMVDFVLLPVIFSDDEYYMIIQAQEKIVDLKIEVSYKANNGRILKTEIIDIGKVVPGNEYKIRLTQSGIDNDDRDKTVSFSYRVVDGTVKK